MSLLPSNTALSLMQKFDRMGRDISALCQERSKLEDQLSQLREDHDRLKQHEETLRAAIQKSSSQNHHSAASNSKEYQAAEQEYRTAQQSLYQVQRQREELQRQYETLKEYCEQERQAFLQDSREFVTLCQQLQWKARDLGLEHAVVRAHALVNGGYDHIFVAEGRRIDQECEDDDDLEADPTTWKHIIPDEKVEWKQLLNDYSENKSLLEETLSTLNRAKATKQAAAEQASSRKDRQDQLQRQLDRITAETNDLEQQALEIQRLTEEIKQKQSNYKAELHNYSTITHMSSVTPSPVPRSSAGTNQHERSTHPYNPYARSFSSSHKSPPAETSSNNHTSRTTSSSHATTQPAVVDYCSTGQESVPPPRRFTKRHREFGTTLHVEGGENVVSHKNHSSRDYVQTLLKSNPLMDELITSNNKKGPVDQSTVEEPPIQTPSSDSTMAVHLWMEEDDDDDDLLDYVAFAK